MELTISVLFSAGSLREAAQELLDAAELLDPAPRIEHRVGDGDWVAGPAPTQPEATPVEQIDLAAVFGTPMVLADPPITKEPAADGEEIDSAGVVWTKGIHADNKAKKQDGTWKTRRGAAKKMPTNNAGRPVEEAEIKTVQDAVGKLIGVGVEIPTIITAISQTVFSDLAKTEGGMEHILKTGDKKLAARAMNALRAVAIANGTTV